MPFPVALTSGNYDSLRGTALINPTYAAAEFLSLCPNNVILACQVNGTPTGNSYAQITFDTVTSGAYTAVIPDMRVIISHTNSQRAAYFDGRVRLDGAAATGATSTILYINETSAPITDNDYVWVINDYRLLDRLPAFAGDVQFKDWNIPFRKLLPYVYGLQSAYAGWISDPANTATKLRIAFSITAAAADSGATISAYLWTFPGTATVISGSTTAAAVTIDFASSTGDWCHLRVTDSNGNTITRHFFVHAASDTYPPLLTASGLSISGSIDGGWNATVEAWSGVSAILDQTFCVAWDEEYYNGTKTNILSNVKFVGRFRQQQPRTTTDLTYSQLQQVDYQIEGIAAQLARLEVKPHTLRPSASPSVWDEIKNVTLWRAIVFMLSEQSTLVNLCDLQFEDVTDTYLTAPLNTLNGNLLEMVKDLAQSTNGVFEFAPQGETRIFRDARFDTNATRNALTTVANYTSQDWIELTINMDPPSTTSKVNASGGFYDTVSGNVTPLLSIAPGAAQDIGPDEVTLARQYLQADSGQVAAQSQLNQRAAFMLEIQRTKTTVTIRFPDGYNFMTPSLSQWYTFTIAATDNALGLVYTTDTRWLCTSVSVAHDNTGGTKDITATFTIETNALVTGQTVQYPSTSEIAPYVPDMPVFGPYPDAFPEDPSLFIGDAATNIDIPAGLLGQSTVPKDGSAVVAWDTSNAKLVITRNFLLSANPTWQDITPNIGQQPSSWSHTIDFTLSDGGWSNSGNSGNGTWSIGTGWSDGGSDLDGTGHYHRYVNLQLNVSAQITSVSFVTNLTKGFFSADDDAFIIAKQGFVFLKSALASTVSSGAGQIFSWIGNETVTLLQIRSECSFANTSGALTGACSILSVTITGTGANPFGGAGTTITHINDADFDPVPSAAGKIGIYCLCDDNTNSFCFYTPDAFANPPQWSLGAAVTGLYKTIRLGNARGQILIFAPDIGGSSKVAVSTNYGATFAAAVSVGTAAANAVGVDTEWVAASQVVLAAQDQKVRKSATLGGSFADETNGAVTGAEPTTIILPWYLIGSTTSKNTGVNPDYFLGSSALVTGEALWKVTSGGGKAAITPSSGGVKALAVSANGLTCYKGTRIAYLGSVTGTTKLFASSNTGSTWVEVGNYASTFILIRRRASTPGQCYWNVGATIRYSKNIWAATPVVLTKSTPLVSVSGLDIFG